MGAIEILEEDLKIASKILEWEIGDMWGHVGVRLPENQGIAVKMFRLPDDEKNENWIIHFDFALKKLSGVGEIPNESAIYTEIFKARPEINAIAHTHAPMCITLSMADKRINTLHLQSKQFAGGVPIFRKPIYIMDRDEGKELAETLGNGVAVVIRGHGIVTVGGSIPEACFNTVYLERTAKMQAVAQLLGYKGTDSEFVTQMNQSYMRLLAHLKKPGTAPRYADEWRYYRAKVLKDQYWSRGWV